MDGTTLTHRYTNTHCGCHNNAAGKCQGTCWCLQSTDRSLISSNLLSARLPIMSAQSTCHGSCMCTWLLGVPLITRQHSNQVLQNPPCGMYMLLEAQKTYGGGVATRELWIQNELCGRDACGRGHTVTQEINNPARERHIHTHPCMTKRRTIV